MYFQTTFKFSLNELKVDRVVRVLLNLNFVLKFILNFLNPHYKKDRVP